MAKKFAALLVNVALLFTLASPANASIDKSNKIAILYEQGGRGDHAINDAVAVGVDAIKKEYGLTSVNVREMVTTGSDADRYSRLLFLANANYSLIVAVGSGFESVMTQAATVCPNSEFAIIDDENVASLNVSNMAFDGPQGAYLAGVLAGAASKSLKVGFIAPSEDAAWFSAFQQGVKAANLRVTPLEALVDSSPTPQTKSLYSVGVDVIFSEWTSTSEVADTAALLSTKKHPLYLVGLSPDQYFLLQKSDQNLLLGAVTKRVDIAVEDVMTAALNSDSVIDVLNESRGIFGHLYTVQNGGEAMALTSLGSKYSQKVGDAIAAIKSGKIKFAA